MHAPTLLASSLLSNARLPHAFSTRQGGHSAGIFASLNFGNPSELQPPERDTPATIAANLSRVLDALGVPGREVVQVHQVHGSHVHVVRPGQNAHEQETTRADAIVTDDATRVIAVRIADCTPVLLASADGRVVGAVHAGWRGVVAGIATRAIDAMEQLGRSAARHHRGDRTVHQREPL
jgi:copper oxidase (laccase) domain-containing protein